MIGYVHLHNNDGETDQHLALNSGTVSMAEVCHALIENAPRAVWAIEARQPGPVRESIEWLGEQGFFRS